jgi:hypothetical protein
MAISWTPTFANAGTPGFSSTYNATGQTLGTGDIVVFVYEDIAGLTPCAASSLAVAGVSASLIGTITDSSSTSISVYLAVGVNSATGTIAVTNTGGMGDIAIAGGQQSRSIRPATSYRFSPRRRHRHSIHRRCSVLDNS